MSVKRGHSLCGKDCSYRRLYEGSQASLSDMSAQQAAALNRVARLRQGVISALKQNFPVQFGEAERRQGKRMSSVEDEVLLANLDWLVSAPVRPTAATVTLPPGLADLRAALTELGVAVPEGNDLAAWAAAVASYRPAGPATTGGPVGDDPPPPPAQSPVPQPEPAPTRRRTGQRPLARPSAADIPPPPEEELFLGGDEPPPPPEEPVAFSGDLDALFSEANTLTSLFDPDVPGARAGAAPDLVQALFDEPDVAPEPPPAAVAAPEEQVPSASPATPAAARSPEPAVLPARAAGPAGPTKPELFPATQVPKRKKPRTVRTPRVSAAAPAALDVPIPEAAEGVELTEEMFDQLVSSVVIPRPVFISDLVAQTGNPDLVVAWEQRCRDLSTDSPVRFITAKPRHRDRGHLVIPHSPALRQAAAEFTSSWWAACLDERRLRGAALYEVAVLLHRFGDQVVSSRIEGDVVILRVNQPRGLVGVVLALTTDLGPEGATRKQVADAVQTLLDDRLTLVAVLTYSAAGNALEKLAGAVREEAAARGWTPTAPVIASQSWDFAADGGASALAVL
jgi:hypothetical protein